MAERQLYCAVATRGERVAGVFPNIEGYRLFVLVLRGELSPPDDVA